MKKLTLLLSLLLLNSCRDKYDCPEDYKGWLVVKSEYNDMTIKKGCEYKEIRLPDYYMVRYRLGDTLGQITATTE